MKEKNTIITNHPAGLPLTELHSHLGGAVDAAILWTLAHEQGIKLPTKDYWEFEQMITIKEKGKKAGVSLNPATPLVLVEDILNNIDLLVIMSVNPGFGGQKFIISVLDKIKRARQMIDNIGAKVNIEIDGGVKLDNIGEVSSAGADIFVSGSGVFGTKDYKRTIEEMKRIINGK